MVYENASAGTESFFSAVDHLGAPAVLRSRRSLRTLDALPREAMVNARVFGGGAKGAPCTSSRRVRLGDFLDRLEQGDMRGEGWQLYDFPHPDNFGPDAEVATLLPRACAEFAAGIFEEAELTASLQVWG